ncbi:universal stress protein [Myxococcota bacterium]|nr:universal stress protein [Myxococcota bacterium]
MRYRLLLALDHSIWSAAAAHACLRVAGRAPEQVHVTATHVVNVASFSGHVLQDIAGMLGWEPVIVPQRVAEQVERRGERLLNTFITEAAALGVEVKPRVEHGAVAERLVSLGAEADLLIMGLRGDTEESAPGQGGATVERLVRRASCSVLLTGSTPSPLGRIALGYDGSDGARAALRAVRHLAAQLRCPVTVLYVVDARREPGHDPSAEGVAALREEGLEAEARVVEGEPAEALPAAALEAGADVLALGYRGRGLLKELILGRVTERVLAEVDMPLLIAR